MNTQAETQTATAPKDAVLFKTVATFCQERSMSRATFYREVAAGRLAAVKRGKRTLIRADEAQRYDNSLPPLAA
ncbi:hypothetical protein [uncultured Reyranella sp.]|jgi:hypothetical protein|uniref:hypothetical protein n=1 Tax=uncultured Reyranella sp. TaxID=735512 RepID=UPI00259CBD20|nr:hypothetical protein [uncultured Reyranella sp.]